MKLIFSLGLLSFGFTILAAQDPPVPKQSDPPTPQQPADPKAQSGEPTAPAEDGIEKAVQRIAENAEKASNRLRGKDPGADTRRLQQEILKDIDTLIRKAQQPPPPPMNNDSPPMGGMPPPMGGMPPPMGGMPPPMGGGGMSGNEGIPMPQTGQQPGGNTSRQASDGLRPRRDRQPRGDATGGMKDPPQGGASGGKEPQPARPEPKAGSTGGTEDRPPGTGTAADQFGKASPKREKDNLADLYKDVWGHLPDRMRQEMDLYYREQFMPRYSELLRRYYSSLAEQRRKGPEDR